MSVDPSTTFLFIHGQESVQNTLFCYEDVEK